MARFIAFGPGLLRNQSRAALPGEIRPEPLSLHAQRILQLRKRHEMQEDPNEPGEKATHAKSATLSYREIFADDRHAALVEVLKRTFW
jgi:RecB family exonuclease